MRHRVAGIVAGAAFRLLFRTCPVKLAYRATASLGARLVRGAIFLSGVSVVALVVCSLRASSPRMIARTRSIVAWLMRAATHRN
jgi:hypothetical protein